MTREEILQKNASASYDEPYQFVHWTDYDYRILSIISWERRAGSKDKRSINEAIIMLDTETSKKYPDRIYHNHVVAWTISVRAYRKNLCTLYGHRPDTAVQCVEKIHKAMSGDRTFIYVYNLAYDWVFLRAFFMSEWGTPDRQLNVKSRYPLFIEWESGLMLRDALALSQRSLEKWAKDLNVEHQKAVGKWDYGKIRNQNEIFSADELTYIENDTLAGVECIDTLRISLNKHLYAMPYTATGIPREDIRKIGKKNRARGMFERQVVTWEQQQKLELVFHGGYTHANRDLIDDVITVEDYGIVQCLDFASSYPYCMLSEKFPMENFAPYHACSLDDIVDIMDEYAVMCKLIMKKPRLINDDITMPVIMACKCTYLINPVKDNGRILCAEYLEIYVSEQDIYTIREQYDSDFAACVEVEIARKDYLPKWFRDYVFGLFEDKTKEKGRDKVIYALKKAKLNSCFGMCVQKPVKEIIEEDYDTGDFNKNTSDMTEEEIDEYMRSAYDKYLENKNSILPYQWGVWVTAYAQAHLFELGKCIDGEWIYSDTDSCYATGWNYEKVEAYNQKCKDKLTAAGYGPVVHDGREYWLGVAESEGDKDKYTEFVTVGAKRYCGRCVADGELHITVSGVPKKGATSLKNDIRNFRKGMNFDGITSGKKTHMHFFNDIYTDENGNLTGDSIDLSPCDYLLDDVNVPDWEKIFREQIAIQVYDEE